jgi:hypothetical protein
MVIVVHDTQTGDIIFLSKGADVVMADLKFPWNILLVERILTLSSFHIIIIPS